MTPTMSNWNGQFVVEGDAANDRDVELGGLFRAPRKERGPLFGGDGEASST
jgi:hypothetical protein